MEPYGYPLIRKTYFCNMKFEDYRISDILKRNINAKGFKRPTDIQFKSIPPILKREDVLGIAQTGTGKTAAFAIPVLQNILKLSKNQRTDSVQCVVMAPTHELAEQITAVFEDFTPGLGIEILCIHGGVSQEDQIQKLISGVDIVVATPGRLFDLRSQGYLVLDDLKILVLDEADHMLDMGFIKDIQDLLHFIPKKRQTLFFSATINQKIKKLAYSIVQNPIRIQISPKNPVSKNVTHSIISVEMDDKRFFLERIVNDYPGSKILCFVRTKVRAERVKKAMERVEMQSLTIHSDKTDEERNSTMTSFKTGESKLLIATDISARGIDIPNVDIVINYDLPEVAENYVHRVGRTGRGTQKGSAISFCSEEEKTLLEDIESCIGSEIPVQKIDLHTYTETLDFSKDAHADWKSLLKDEDILKKPKKRKKK
ncbi:MAG: ATP-dependent RNA helicase RhlE [Bacteroidia bacterium]|jgi:ATP-dependent RNA helicase RhlE